jgi:hypothetical protein
MRKVKFRGKDIHGAWHYGSLIVDSVGGPAISNKSGTHLVLPETIGQYTEMTDTIGTEIFEGMQLHVEDTDKRYQSQLVMFKDGAFCGFSELKTCKYTYLDVLIRAHGVRVIGEGTDEQLPS